MSACALLDIIAGDGTTGLIEVRCLNPHNGKVWPQEWFPIAERQSCAAFITSLATQFDVYVGVAPRTREEGGRSAISHAWCLWADCDTPGAVERLADFTPRPSLVIASGSGDNRHAYWRLSRAVSPAWVERANRRIAFALGADQRATDAARILRPPWTFNHKTSPPRSVEVTKTTDTVSTVAGIVARLPDPPDARPTKPHRPDVASDDPLAGISADRYYQTLTGREVTRGNVKCPFHGDGKERNPSMRLYETTWFCFGCQRGGSVYEFGSELWGLGTRGDEFLRLRERLLDALR